jgi:Repeat of unknown function (DUF5648)
MLYPILKDRIHSKPFGHFLVTSAIIMTLSVIIASALVLHVSAAPVVGFNAGKIIDNGIFINASSMNQQQIQNFLVGKVPVCDTNGTQISEYGGGTRAQWGSTNYGQSTFICLKDYSEGGRLASQIIYDAAQEFQINPQVLIVLLQKEQGLVTDTWPLNIQYRSATGYGCPDTAACDSQYYGLTNQVRWSAKMFRAIMNNSPTWYTPYVLGNNFIQYNPNSSCGGSVVNIQNRATQALYNYTPYQPSQAALDAGWGTVNCGAYGNRNFYLYFTQWFGSTVKPSLQECPTTTLECVWAFRNDTNGKYFYTSDYDERSTVYQLNYSSIGIVFYARKSDTIGAQPVYRLYSTTGDHLWTSSLDEKNLLVSTGYWTSEGIGFYQDPISSNTGLPVHRLYNQSGLGVHVVTSNTDEISRLISYGYIDEGVLFNTPGLSAPESPAPIGSNLVYRFLLSNEHFWTTSYAEKQILIITGASYEGVAWQTTTSQTLPVYRLYSPKGEHFWTTSSEERDSITRFGWKYEGISWYTSATGNPTYRFYNVRSGRHLWTPSDDERAILLTYPDWTQEGIAWYK